MTAKIVSISMMTEERVMMSCVLTKKKKIFRSSCKSGQRERLSFRSI